jgi:hypothetical protein
MTRVRFPSPAPILSRFLAQSFERECERAESAPCRSCCRRQPIPLLPRKRLPGSTANWRPCGGRGGVAWWALGASRAPAAAEPRLNGRDEQPFQSAACLESRAIFWAVMTLLPSFCSVNGCYECHTSLRLFAFCKKRRPVTPKVAGSSPVAPASKSIPWE